MKIRRNKGYLELIPETPGDHFTCGVIAAKGDYCSHVAVTSDGAILTELKVSDYRILKALCGGERLCLAKLVREPREKKGQRR